MLSKQYLDYLGTHFARLSRENTFGGTIHRTSGGTKDIGSPDAPWDNIYADSVVAGVIVGQLTGSEWESVGDMYIDAHSASANTTLYVVNQDSTYQASLNVEKDIIVGGTVDGVDLAGFNAAQFLVLAASTHMANERIATAGDGIDFTDGGAGGNLTIDVDYGSGLDISSGALIHGTGDFGDLHTNYAEHDGTETITGAWTFDRDPSAPFAVASGSAYVQYLDSDKLDGYEASEFPRKAENATITGTWDFPSTGFTIGSDVALSRNAANVLYTPDSLYVGTAGSIGVGTSPTNPLDINRTFTHTSGTKLGAYILAFQSGGGSSGLNGMGLRIRNSTASTGDLLAMSAEAEVLASINEVKGGYFLLDLDAGTVGAATGLEVLMDSESGVSVTNAYFAHLDTSYTTAGTIGTLYGLKIGNISLGTIGNYAIHTSAGTVSLGDDLAFRQSSEINTTSTYSITLKPGGNLYLDPGSDVVLPPTNYSIDLGSAQYKYLQLHAGELWVDTLVAQSVVATIGGRIIVAPTSSLSRDLDPGHTTIYLAHNSFASGDRIYMEKDGQLEWMALTSGPTDAGDDWSYSVSRNLDGTGANQWYAGDAVVSTGTTGDGFMELYSQWGVLGKPLTHIFNFNNTGSVYSDNHAGDADWTIFGDGAGTEVGDMVYYGHTDDAFGWLYWYIVQPAVWSITYAWEYYSSESGWLTLFTSTTPNFTTPGVAILDVGTPSGFVKTTINSVEAYWVRSRITAFTSVTTLPTNGGRFVRIDNNQVGPTIAGWIRTGTDYDAITSGWAVGNLNGLYDYGTDTFGVALGYYASGENNLTVDATNGIRMRNYTTTIAQWSGDTITLGDRVTSPSKQHLRLDSTSIKFYADDGTTDTLMLDDTSVRVGRSGSQHVTVDASSIKFYEDSGSAIVAEWDNTTIALGAPVTSPSSQHLRLDSTSIKFYADNGTTITGEWDNATIYIGTGITSPSGEHIRIDSSAGIRIMDGNYCRGQWDTSGNIKIGYDISGAATTAMVVVGGASLSWNGETLYQGDILIGDNTTGNANIFWDKSTGILNFRSGTATAEVEINSSGQLTAGGGAVVLDDDGIKLESPVSYSITAGTLKFYNTEFGVLIASIGSFKQIDPWSAGGMTLLTETVLASGGEDPYVTIESDEAVGDIVAIAGQHFIQLISRSVNVQAQNGYDPKLLFDSYDAAQDWCMGVDDDDGDRFKICKGTAIGTNDYFEIDTSGNWYKGGQSSAGYIFIPLTTPCTTTKFDGDTFSDVSPGSSYYISYTDWNPDIPSNAKAILLQIVAYDSGTGSLYVAMGPSTTYWYAVSCRVHGSSLTHEIVAPCPTDGAGKVYYSIDASGTNTMTAWARCWGYWI